MPPEPIKTYYDGSAEEEADLLALRKDHYRTLRVLQRQAATYGGAVPSQIALAIADAESQIRAIDDARKSRIRPETAERLGSTGQFAVLAERINLVSEQIRSMQRSADDWRESTKDAIERLADIQHDSQRINRFVFIAIGVILAVIALVLLGLAGAIWSLMRFGR